MRKVGNNNLNKNDLNVKKGTIPFYFKLQKGNKKSEIPSRKLDVNNSELNSNFPPKKGTIPFYFQKALTTSKTFFRSHK